MIATGLETYTGQKGICESCNELKTIANKLGECWKCYRHRKGHNIDSYKKHNLSKYGISYYDYLLLLQKQNGCCKVCGKEDKEKLHIDHCHKTKAVRGLLCSYCNMAIGILESHRYEKLMEYLGKEIK